MTLVNRLYTVLFVCIAALFFSCNNPNSLFKNLSPSATNIHFENKLEQRKAFGILYYLYYYNGGGVAIGDVNNDGLPDIYFTANSKGNNKLYLNKGNMEFEDITDEAGVQGNADWCSGVTMADVNGDGLLDIYVSAVSQHHGLEGKNQLFINNGFGGKKTGRDVTFKESAAEYGLDFSGFTTQAGFFDYDHDGDLDCYLLNQSHQPNANIVDTVNRRKFDAFAGDRLYRNDINKGQKKFTDVSAAAGIYQSSLGYGLGIAVADFNNDGWEDIYVGNDFHENDYYYLNNGNGTFTESGAKHFGHYSRFSMGNDAADYNNDGQTDIVTVDMLPPDEKVLKTYGSDENPDIYKFKLIKNGFQYQYSKNCLQRNNGNGVSFSETSLLSGVSATDWSWSPLFADLDNDGNKDLFITSGIVKRPVDLDYVRFVSDLASKIDRNSSDKYDAMTMEKMPDGSSHPFVFKGDGDLTFKDVSADWGTSDMKGFYTGAAYADLDNDGDVDMVVNSLNATSFVLQNNAPKRKYLAVKFEGDGYNTMGIGCKTYLFQKGKMQYQQMMPTRGFQSSSDLVVHFGLGDNAAVDSLLVVWPDQKYQLIKNIKADQQLIVSKKNAAGFFSYNVFFTPQQQSLTDITGQVSFNWKHQENNFNDFDIQYLIPHAQSTRGPKMAVADVNSDGLDDVYPCGAKGQFKYVLLQQPSGKFIKSDSISFAPDIMSEDVDAIFFDANKDGKPDLYVASGGNEYNGPAPFLKDRLYINDGKGHFTKSEQSIPPIYENKSTVAVSDVDHDGDMDVFVGSMARSNAYGKPVNSYLLLNDGNANFSIAPQSIIDLTNAGMVTSSSFADFNKDGWPDLIIAGEWMPVTVYINKAGKFQKQAIANSTGLWQSVFAADVNNDGNTDLLLGNWGWNNKFWSGKNGPMYMYVDDYDRNGNVDQLLAYTLDGKQYPFLAKDEVERPLPLLKKHYLNYADYAGVEMKDVFYGWIDSIKPLMAEKLGSSVALNDGKGGFTLNDLPADLQLAPVFSFAELSAAGKKQYVAAGNFYDVIPYEGRYDAQALAMFSFDNGKARSIPQTELAAQTGQFRDLKWIRTANNTMVLIAARNNEHPLFFGYNNSFAK